VERYRDPIPKQPEVVNYGGDAEMVRLQLPCDGAIKLVVEPFTNIDMWNEIVDNIQQRKIVCRELEVSAGQSKLFAGDHGDVLSFDGKRLKNVFGPQWRLMIIGAGQTSQYLAQMANALSYDVTVCEPREEYLHEWRVDAARIVESMPDDAVQDINPDNRTAVVTLTHDPKLDDLALLQALNSDAFYIGALGSSRNNGKRRERLISHFNISDSQLNRLRGPVGLPIGSRTPAEIALSILAELTAVRHGKSLVLKTSGELEKPAARLHLVDKATA
jgi:xanthine dehydrogenase accessory factor